MADSEPLNRMPLMQHLGELRTRIFYAAAAILLCAIGAYFISEPIFGFLTDPYYRSFPDNMLIGTGPAEAFVLKVKVACFSGAIIASPFLFYQLWLFIAPGLYSHERRMVLPFVLMTTLLFFAGVAFSYYVIFPFAFDFFHAQYLSINITPAVRLSEHLSTMISGMLAFGVVFEMPILAFLLGRLGVIDDAMLTRSFRHAIVIIFIISAIVTPPDVLTQFLMAGPLLLLYALSIVIVRYTKKKPEPAATPGE